MRASKLSLSAILCALALGVAARGQAAFNGFDRNDYPGDARLDGLRQSFRFVGYWLNAPPGERASTWTGKRALLRSRGFGFLLLWNGRVDKQLQGADPAALGRADADAAVAAASRDGFPAGALIFLDQEEGGRLLPEQVAYVLAFVERVRQAQWRAGIYCSGIPVPDGNGGSITTAEDIERHAAAQPNFAPIALWVARDQCPPSPGCAVESRPRHPSATLGLPEAVVWQYALSPQRAQFTGGCPKHYAQNGNCYPPGTAHSTIDVAGSFIDLDTADSPDPSGGR
jgi:Rv2525c-like, glycoside hydrolase-like domain